MPLSLLKVLINGEVAEFPEANASHEKCVELERFVANEGNDLLHREIVDHLGKLALEHEGDGASAEEIARVVKGKRGKALSPDYVRQVMVPLRKSLGEYNERQAQEGRPYHLVLPLQQASWHYYTLQFEAQANANPTVRLWQRMAFSRKSRDIALLYDTPNVRSSVPWFNIPGQFSGSGDVAAAALITQVLARIQPHFDINPHRYCDLGTSNRDALQGVCQIILGTSSADYFERNIRDHQTMRGRPVFRFRRLEEAPQGGIFQEFNLTREPAFDYPDMLSETLIATGDAELRSEYAVVSFFKCSDRTIIALQGMSSTSTLGAALLMWDRRISAILRDRFEQCGIDMERELPSFELLLKVQIGRNEVLKVVDVVELIPHVKPHRQAF